MIRPDWKAYFREFCNKHGRHPVEIGNKLVFPDGWSYARNDYRGPEWPPPSVPEDLWRLKREYWKRRCAIIRKQRDALSAELENFAKQQLSRDATIQVNGIETYTDDDGHEHARMVSVPVDWQTLKLKLQFLNEDLYQSEMELRTLEGL